MEFSKKGIAEFKAKRRYYTTWRKKLIPKKIKECFYNNNDECNIKTLFPGKKLQYCNSYMYELVVGDYQAGIKYVDGEETYYLFWAANSYYAYPQSIAIGKAVDGKVYLIKEDFPRMENNLNFRIIPEEYINTSEMGFRPKSYNHSVLITSSNIKAAIEELTDMDVKTIKIAYEAIRAFGKLIAEAT